MKLFLVCNFETRFSARLKAHMTMLHDKVQTHPCENYDSKFKTMVERDLHVIKRHKKCMKHSKLSIICENCESTFESEKKLNDHKRSQHSESDQQQMFNVDVSPSSSPPRKIMK